MHVVTDGAVSLRERKVAETSDRIRRRARALAAEVGYSGFTIEELCHDVGVSRRTFFNYFASKEDAVLGLSARDDQTARDDAFLRRGPESPYKTLSSSLIDDLVELMTDRWRDTDLDAAGLDLLVRAVQQAPRLLTRAIEISREQESHDVGLITRREHLAHDDLRAEVLVHVMGTLMRISLEEALAGDGDESLREALRRRVDAMRAVLQG